MNLFFSSLSSFPTRETTSTAEANKISQTDEHQKQEFFIVANIIINFLMQIAAAATNERKLANKLLAFLI